MTGQSKDCDTQVNVMACWPLVFCLFGGFLFENPRSPFEKLDIYPPPPPPKKKTQKTPTILPQKSKYEHITFSQWNTRLKLSELHFSHLSVDWQHFISSSCDRVKI